jgi:hypothetical protein
VSAPAPRRASSSATDSDGTTRIPEGKELTFTEITATDGDGAVVAHAVQTYRIV